VNMWTRLPNRKSQ